MKRNAMQEFLHLFGDTVREDALNVISIGDSLSLGQETDTLLLDFAGWLG